MQFTFLHPFKLKVQDEHALVPVHEVRHNTSEGGEFLDDALRMEDLIPTHTEECLAAGSPDNLL